MKKEEQSFCCGISVSQKSHALSGWILRFVPLFAMLFATLAAKAASDGDGVTFNKDVRYSQWAINSRLHDFYGNTKLFGFDVYDANNTKKSTVQWKNDKKANIDKSFDYVAGLVAKATLEAADYYARFDWSKPWFYSAQAFANEVTYSNSSKPTLDAMNAVKMYFPILSSSLKSDNVVTKANTALAALAKDMQNYNTKYSIGGSTSKLNGSNASDAQKKMFGGWFHKSSDYVDQMWLDGAYMGSATLAQLTGYLGDSKNIFGSKEADWNMVAKQLNIVWNQCWDSNKQLMYHAFSATGAATASKSTKDTWAGISNSADAPVYHSAAFWGRANSWYLFALVDALEAMKNDNQENTENYKTLKGHLDSFAAGIVKWQDQTTGGWYQVMDEKGDYNASNYNSSYCWTTSYNNYIETSATAIFSAALFKAVRLGLLGDTYKNAAKKAFEGIVNNFVAPKADGTINIWSSSRSAGLGGSNYRDGSKIYYILGKDTKIVTKEDNLTEGKVLGGFIMAATEYEHAYQNQDGSAQILFSYDLKPSYDLTQSGAAAPKVEVCGTDAANATYQWYDATTKAAVEGATKASFTPSETGNYYCKATVGSTSIQTSTTNIKVNSGGGETGGETTPETLFSYDVPASGDLSTTDTNEGVTGGKIMFASKKNDGGKYKIDGDAKYVKVTLSGNSLKAGDVISVKASAPNSGYGCSAALDTDKKTTLKLGNLTGKGPEDISYTVTKTDILNGQSSFYLFRETGKSIYVHSITITRKTTTQTTSPLVIAVEDVEMNVTDEVTKQPEVKVFGTADKLLTPGTDYTLSFSTDNNNVTVNESGVFKAAGSKFNYTEGVTNVTVTATPSAALAGQYTEATWTFTFTVRKGKMKPVFMSAFNGATIKVAKGTRKTIEVPLNYGGEDVSGYFDVKYSCSDLSNLTSSDNKMTYTFSTAGKYQIKVSATPKIINQGKDDEFDYADEYDAPDNVTFTVDVSGTYTVPKVTLNPSTDKTIYVGQVVDAPAVSVTGASGTAIDVSKYTMVWTSFAPDVCKVDATTGKIEGVSAGDKVKIQLKVSGEGYEDVFAYVLVSVDDPAKYRVKAPGSKETYSPMTPLFNQNKTLAVTLGGWIFTDRLTAPVSKEGLTYGDKNKWPDDSSKATWVIKGFDYYLPGLTCQNARQEDGACPLPSETQWYNGKLQPVKGGTVDPMFYVPCSGAYLTVEPKKNGKVSVSVFQNGVFDKSDGVYAYRPQRRVFVLDEAGKVVASEATISATGGKLTVADKKATGDLKDPYKITNYPCNITGLANGTMTDGGKSCATKYPSPTVDDVKKHFRGMTSFVMTEAGFQNNVYESNIDNKATWGDNATPNNGADDNVMGSHGWSVLVDAAVTYTFDVKAGKTYYIYNYGSKLGFYGFSFDEAAGQTVKNYNFDEATTNTIELTKAGELTTAKVNRAMKAGVWTTCVLPFSLNKQQVDAIFGKTYDRDNTNGTQILYFDRVEGTKAIFVRHAYNNIVAGKPFLIKPAQDVASINTAEVTDYPYVTIENTQPAEWCKGNGYVWMSSYSNDMTVQAGDCFISNKDGSFKNFVGTPGTLKGFRGYLKHIGTNGVSEAKKLTVGMGSNVTSDETSAIDGILIDGDMPADSVTAADGKVYNLNGQVVATSYRQFQTLPGGVYVVNGKKVVK